MKVTIINLGPSGLGEPYEFQARVSWSDDAAIGIANVNNGEFAVYGSPGCGWFRAHDGSEVEPGDIRLALERACAARDRMRLWDRMRKGEPIE